MSDSGIFVGGSCFCFVLVPAVILIILSFATLEPVEYGLNFNAITMSLENKTYSIAGLYFLGFGHWFIVSSRHALVFISWPAGVPCASPASSPAGEICLPRAQRFPRIIQTIEFMANSENQLLHTRTSDGLPLTLGLSFQYRYIPEHLHTLYLTYKGEHHAVYVNTATATIANVACNYSAYTFFNDKQGIAIAMRQRLNLIFQQQLYAQVRDLPRSPPVSPRAPLTVSCVCTPAPRWRGCRSPRWSCPRPSSKPSSLLSPPSRISHDLSATRRTCRRVLSQQRPPCMTFYLAC